MCWSDGIRDAALSVCDPRENRPTVTARDRRLPTQRSRSVTVDDETEAKEEKAVRARRSSGDGGPMFRLLTLLGR